MRRLTLTCCLLASAALAAPLPKPKESGFQGPGWGKPIDPDKACNFTFAKGALTVEAPGKLRDLYRKNAPRVLRRVKGDFEAQVRLLGDIRAVAASDNYASVSAGLLVADKDDPESAYWLVWGASREGARAPEPFSAATMMGKGGKSISTLRYPKTATVRATAPGGKLKEGHLKVERRGGRLTGYVSADGKEWELIPRRPEGEKPDTIEGEVKVGVAVFVWSAATSKVTFDSFKLKPLKAKAK
jgi:hypothetical protein